MNTKQNKKKTVVEEQEDEEEEDSQSFFQSFATPSPSRSRRTRIDADLSLCSTSSEPDDETPAQASTPRRRALNPLRANKASLPRTHQLQLANDIEDQGGIEVVVPKQLFLGKEDIYGKFGTNHRRTYHNKLDRWKKLPAGAFYNLVRNLRTGEEEEEEATLTPVPLANKLRREAFENREGLRLQKKIFLDSTNKKRPAKRVVSPPHSPPPPPRHSSADNEKMNSTLTVTKPDGSLVEAGTSSHLHCCFFFLPLTSLTTSSFHALFSL